MFNIRLALPCDVKDVFELSNDKDVRKNSLDSHSFLLYAYNC